MEEGRGMLEGGTTTVTPSNLCVLMSMVGGGTATIAILNRECVLMSAWRWCNHNLHLEMCVCVLMSMLGGGTVLISILNCVCVCLCQCLSLETCVLLSMFGGTATISMYS